MTIIYTLNYIVFSAFFVLFTIEVGIALLFLLDYNSYKDKLRRYLLPIWQVTGTFAIFYVVNFEASFPGSLSLIANMFLVPVLIAAMFFIGRNAFIAYSEYIGDVVRERTYTRIYAMSTIITAFVATAVLCSAISGIGVNVQSQSINLAQVLVNPFDILVFVSIALLALFIDGIFFNVDKLKKIYMAAAPVGIVVILVALELYLRYAVNSFLANPICPIVLFALLLITIFLNTQKVRISRYLAIAWLFVSINILGASLYPYWFGGTANSNAYLVNAATGYYTVLITLAGGLLVAIAMAFFVYINYVKKEIYSKPNYK